MNTVIIAVDAMGGDYGPSVTIPAALISLNKFSNLHLILVGNAEIINSELANGDVYDKTRVTVYHASEQVAMDEAPAKALRFKKDSSMRVAANLVKAGHASAFVSAGNTGALMATAHFVFKTLPDIDRPAIMASLPTLNPNKVVRVLDLGANVDSLASNLYQFAVMGSVVTSALENIDRPKVGLLNIGTENIKGNEQVKEAAKLIQENKSINYIGYVEGDELFKGEVDVVICDGFVGNVFLKSIEGVAKLIGFYVKKEFFKNIYTKIAALISKKILKNIANDVDPSKYNGASFLGLQGIVIKSHGSANIAAFSNAILEALHEVEKNVPKLISAEVSKILKTTG